jgi:glucose/arabinose dehydrogenase
MDEDGMRKMRAVVGLCLALAGAAGLLFACAERASLPLAAGFGPEPQLPEPKRGLVPTVNIAPAISWPAGAHPNPAPGSAVTAFASGLAHLRNVLVLPNGDVLVAESNAPPKPDHSPGIAGWVMLPAPHAT